MSIGHDDPANEAIARDRRMILHDRQRRAGDDARREAGMARDLAHEADQADEQSRAYDASRLAERSQAHALASIATMLAGGEVDLYARVKR